MPVVKAQGTDAKRIWRQATAVCFDVDSTLIQVEGIDKLAQFCGAGEAVAKLTVKAMGGSMTFRDALKTRLNIIRPSFQQVMELTRLHTPKKVLTPGVESLLQILQSRGVAVYLVSGGFRQVIEPYAEHLGIPKENIFANRLLFSENGEYAGFDESEPTSESGGKAYVVGLIKQKHDVVVMIGDGATDMEASPPADTFIGFGGNQVREKVKVGAPWFVYSFQELIDELRPLEKGYTHHNGVCTEESEHVKPKMNGVCNGISDTPITNGIHQSVHENSAKVQEQ